MIRHSAHYSKFQNSSNISGTMWKRSCDCMFLSQALCGRDHVIVCTLVWMTACNKGCLYVKSTIAPQYTDNAIITPLLVEQACVTVM